MRSIEYVNTTGIKLAKNRRLEDLDCRALRPFNIKKKINTTACRENATQLNQRKVQIEKRVSVSYDRVSQFC